MLTRKRKKKRKISKSQDKSEYETIKEPIILLNDTFWQFCPYDLSWEFKNEESTQVILPEIDTEKTVQCHEIEAIGYTNFIFN